MIICEIVKNHQNYKYKRLKNIKTKIQQNKDTFLVHKIIDLEIVSKRHGTMLSRSVYQSKRVFSSLIDLSNQRIPLVDPEDGQKLDNHLNRYKSPVFSAYLYKRKIAKEQVYPKMYIIDDIPVEEQNHLKCQSLFPLKNAMDEVTMQRLVKQDPTNINSSYVISVFCQNHFKPMIDQYVKKVLVCGKAPKRYDKMREIQQRVLQLHKTYYYGEPITQLQRQIELKYLSEKQSKYISYHDIIKDGNKNQYTRCIWRQQDQRILEDLVNWRKTDPESDDTNFRPYYESLQLLNRAIAIQKLYKYLGITNWFDRRKFNKEVKIYFETSQQYYNLIADKIYNRIHQYISSVQFTNLLKIPPDFMIEMAMYQIHIWLICSRLDQLDTRDTRYLSKLILQNFKNRLEAKASSFNLKKENILVRNLHKMLMQNKNILRLHFQLGDITKNNHYKGIDALVWSILFFEKVDRYGDQVYLMSEYLIKNYQMIQNYGEEDLKNGMIEFDAYLVDPKYKEIITKVNPPLSKQEFDKQFNSDKLQKSYHYSQIQKQIKVPLDIFKRQDQRMKITWGQLLRPIGKFLRKFHKKYQTLETMDHYSQIEKQQKVQKQKQQKTIWKSKIDNVKQTKSEYNHMKQIRRQLSVEKNKRNSWSNIVKPSNDESAKIGKNKK